MKLSVLIPVFNERYLVAELVRRVLAAPLPAAMSRELVIVDDGSTDGTREILEQLARENPDTIHFIKHSKNAGKGAAVRTAIAAATGEISIFQDADLEYDPQDYVKILGPLLQGHADVVYGSRFLSGERRRVLYFWHSFGNRVLTTLSNIFTDLNLTDMETGYKAFRTSVLKSIPIRCRGFGLEPEITAKIAKRGLRIYEVPISYDGRTYLEGKKITWKDGIRALGVIVKYWLIDDLYDEKSGHEILASISKATRFNRWMADTAVRPFMGHRVLEIGAGIGNMTLQLLPRERYIASEMDPLHLEVLDSLKQRNTSLEAVSIDAEKAEQFAPYAGQVDTVVCLNVLEHIPDSAAALKNMYDVLEPGGRAIILVPQGPWLYCPLDKALEHVKRYTPQQLNEALKAAGFEVRKTFHFNRIGVFGWFLNGKILRRTRMAKYQLKMFDSLVWLWRRIDWLLPWHGLSIVTIAEKPKGAAGLESKPLAALPEVPGVPGVPEVKEPEKAAHGS
ncbi:MAG TPA: bifunctional glycosyltransferase/class I SAM-dependent methyltransferase [Planctomycetota bacterium]|nr:bifunctional glycosyltransferase/class I SAM-dependent methyltransferase [Planctomycetota bacterium]